MYPGPLPPGQSSPVQIKDWSHWQHNEYTLLQAACLWAGIEPLDSLQDLRCSPEATARYYMLTRAVKAGELEVAHLSPAPRTIVVPADGEHGPEMLASREDLREFASSIKDLPLFLFPAPAVSQEDSAQGDDDAFRAATPSHKRDPQAQTSYKRKVRLLHIEVQRKWPNPAKRPPIRQMAKDPALQKITGYTEETLRKRLRKLSGGYSG